jgi:hypothetical protein
VAKVEFLVGELFPRVGFIVPNLETDSRVVVRFYNQRGTAEQWIKEGKQAVKMTRSAAIDFGWTKCGSGRLNPSTHDISARCKNLSTSRSVQQCRKLTNQVPPELPPKDRAPSPSRGTE